MLCPYAIPRRFKTSCEAKPPTLLCPSPYGGPNSQVIRCNPFPFGTESSLPNDKTLSTHNFIQKSKVLGV